MWLGRGESPVGDPLSVGGWGSSGPGQTRVLSWKVDRSRALAAAPSPETWCGWKYPAVPGDARENFHLESCPRAVAAAAWVSS